MSSIRLNLGALAAVRHEPWLKDVPRKSNNNNMVARKI